MTERRRHPLDGEDWADRLDDDLPDRHVRSIKARAALFGVVAATMLVWVLATRLF